MTTSKSSDAKANIAFHTVKKLMDDQFERMENFYAEYGRYEKQGIEQANATIAEMTKTMKDSVDYARQISSEFRKVARETTQRAAEMWTGWMNH